MGYTHYWRFDRDASPLGDRRKGLAVAGEKVRRVIEMSGVSIRGWEGVGEPEFTQELVAFNGDAEMGEDHESFVVRLEEEQHEDEGLRSWQMMNKGFGFCKTQRKPYDIVVCCALIALSESLEGFMVSSDGGAGDWSNAFRLYREFVDHGFDEVSWVAVHLGDDGMAV